MKVISNPFEMNSISGRSSFIGITVLSDLPNFTADLAVFLRLLVVYPRSNTSRTRFLSMIVPGVTIKLLRTTFLILMVTSGDQATLTGMNLHWSREQRAWILINRVFALVDSTCVPF
jgi:hypothetical protein